MTCNQLAGACDMEFHADTFDEIGNQSKKHAMEMVEKGDKDHLDAMEKMRGLMDDPKAIQDFMNKKRKEFESLPEGS